MSARYLLRLDDACATMDHQRWELLERVLDRHEIRPLVAVVPDNRDTKLVRGPPDAAFWDKVRAWAAKGWCVAMHGHTHVMHATDAALLVPLYKRSEFAGLPLEAQAAKIKASWLLFREQGIAPQVWIAPAHSFDRVTLEALRRETPIRIVSDGIAWNTYHEHGFHWVPQQLSQLRARRSGVWTVCLHPNTMSEATIDALDRDIASKFRGRIVGLQQIELGKRPKTILDRLYHGYFWRQWRREMARG